KSAFNLQPFTGFSRQYATYRLYNINVENSALLTGCRILRPFHDKINIIMNNSHFFRAKRQLKRATERGANLTEFSAALVVLVIGFMIPLLDLGVIPIHWLLSKEIISSYVRKLALCETFSQAVTQVNSDPALQNWLTQLGGVKPESIQCHLVISKL